MGEDKVVSGQRSPHTLFSRRRFESLVSYSGICILTCGTDADADADADADGAVNEQTSPSSATAGIFVNMFVGTLGEREKGNEKRKKNKNNR